LAGWRAGTNASCGARSPRQSRDGDTQQKGERDRSYGYSKNHRDALISGVTDRGFDLDQIASGTLKFGPRPERFRHARHDGIVGRRGDPEASAVHALEFPAVVAVRRPLRLEEIRLIDRRAVSVVVIGEPIVGAGKRRRKRRRHEEYQDKRRFMQHTLIPRVPPHSL
jgi:hypothetical protein